MNKLTDEQFFAWLDGELSGAEAAIIEARVAADPELSARAAQHREMTARLRSAFQPVAAAPVPERVAAALESHASSPVNFAPRQGSPGGRQFPRLPQWAAMAATLALGMFLGTLIASGHGSGPVEARDGAIYAAGSLDSALEQQLASGGGGSEVRVGLTFRDQAGTICRSFTAQKSSGLACREGGDWRLRGVFPAPEGQAGDYRMAAGQDPNLAELIDATISGEPFDAAQEARALQGGWR